MKKLSPEARVKVEIIALFLLFPLLFLRCTLNDLLMELPFSFKIPDQIQTYALEKNQKIVMLPLYFRQAGIFSDRNRYYAFENAQFCEPSNTVEAAKRIPPRFSLGIELKKTGFQSIDAAVGYQLDKKRIGWFSHLMGVFMIFQDGETLYVSRRVTVRKNGWKSLEKYWVSAEMKDHVYNFFSSAQYAADLDKLFRTLNQHHTYDFINNLSDSENSNLLSFLEKMKITDRRAVKDRWEHIARTSKMETPQYFSMTFNTDPAGADVYIDEVHQGSTPLQVSYQKGWYFVQIKKDGYEDVVSEISLPAQSNSVHFVLKKSQ